MQASRQVAKIGRQVPNFTCSAWWQNKIQNLSLEQFRGKYVVLFFYPQDFTFVCPTEICAFSDKAPEFEAMNCQVIGASVDSAVVHREYTLKARENGGIGPMQIPLISDCTHEISKDYGCFIDEGDAHGFTWRATYIIDDKGVLRHSSMNDLPVGRNPDEVLRLVKGYQYTDKHGLVCPASWDTGKATMPAEHGKQLDDFWATEHGKK